MRLDRGVAAVVAVWIVVAAAGYARLAGDAAARATAAPDGAALYAENCAACHGADGRGVAGENPPLAGSDWVSGDDRRLISVVLHGLAGPITVSGKPWDGQMPAFGQLSDAETAALLTHVRQSFDTERPRPITPAEVAKVRAHGERYGATGAIAAREGVRTKEYKSFPKDHIDLAALKLPPGFRIELFARVNDARSLARGSAGTIFVGNSRYGEEVYAVVDADGDHRAETVHTLASGLVRPNAVAFHDGDLYVGEVTRILRFPGIESRLANPPKPEVIYSEFPNQTKHEKKFMKVGPDGRLYVPVGADCNVCAAKNPMDGTIVSMKPDGSDVRVVARGVRNSVGMDWHPETRELWFTDNGRDLMGDDTPPCEINRLASAGQNFGFPACHGKSVVDPEFGGPASCAEATAPEAEIQAHSAPLGMIFYTGTMFPAEYRGAVFVAEHGSWNRSKKVGYQVSIARMKDGRIASYEPFISGWLDAAKDDFWGRPVDLLQLPDGSVLLSDDWANAVYRISYEAPGQ